MRLLASIGAFFLCLIALVAFAAYYFAKRQAKTGGKQVASGGDRLFFLVNLVLLGKTLPQLDAELAAAEARIKARREALALKAAMA